ncbi:MAG: DUF1844 domain-containing protein [Myxococcaceae bacterium]
MGDKKEGSGFVMQGPAELQVSFHSFLLGLAGTALVHLGATPHPESGKLAPNLPLARHSLDVLALLRDKTRGNLTPDEEHLFDSLLADMRLRFVEANKS